MNISVHCFQSTVKVMGNKGEDSGEMGVTSKKKCNVFQTKGQIDFFQK